MASLESTHRVLRNLIATVILKKSYRSKKFKLYRFTHFNLSKDIRATMAVDGASSIAMNTSDSSTRLLAPEHDRPPLVVRIAIFSASFMAIVAQYLYFTLPLSFLTNEVVIVSIKSCMFYNPAKSHFVTLRNAS